MSNTVNKVLAVAEGEVGYLEKKTNAQLESKTANAGKNNYTKYGKAMGCNGYAWCDAFVDWCFVQAYSKSVALKILGGFSNYTPTSAQYFKNMKRWYTKNPKVGDIIFFKNSVRIYHTGIVYKVTSSRVYTIEGNTSTAVGVVENGGGVCKKSYDINYSKIAGYGRPNYDVEEKKTSIPTTTSNSKYSQKKFIEDYKSIMGLSTSATLEQMIEKSITISAGSNKYHSLVTPLERYMKYLGYYKGTIEADLGKKPCFGNGMKEAIKQYQKEVVKATAKNCDGIISKKKSTWKKLLSEK